MMGAVEECGLEEHLVIAIRRPSLTPSERDDREGDEQRDQGSEADEPG
jgi:hypothetical protein